MDRVKFPAVRSEDVARSLAPNGRNETGMRTGTNFSTVLARTGVQEVAPVLLPIARSAQALAPNALARLPMSGPTQPDTGERLHESALGLRAYRQQMLASNIANADTPGYKAADIDIKEALRSGVSASSKLDVMYQLPGQGSVDGNTVEMDVERAKFAENALMYEYEVDRVKGFYKNMDDLLKGMPY